MRNDTEILNSITKTIYRRNINSGYVSYFYNVKGGYTTKHDIDVICNQIKQDFPSIDESKITVVISSFIDCIIYIDDLPKKGTTGFNEVEPDNEEE